MSDAATPPVRAADRWVGAWLVVMAVLVTAMVIVGGLTRLTDSGLSITEWAPVTGVVPPLSEEAWARAFAQYQEIPEYQLQNRGMGIEAFKTIYWWEWGHRFLGRLIGLAFFVPLVVFWLTGAVRPHLRWRLAGLFLLGGLQGFVGWWMVASGLVDRVDVSQVRLAVHLLLAFLILAALWWTALDAFDGPPRQGRPNAVANAAFAFLGLVFVQVGLGALVAGLDAGRTYTTWPMIDGGFVPLSYADLEPWWRNLIDNRAAVQFNHRTAGYLAAILAVALWAYAVVRRAPVGVRRLAAALAAAVAGQTVLGVITLINAAPLSLAILHQGMAVVLIILAAWLGRAAMIDPAPQAAHAGLHQPHHQAPAR